MTTLAIILACALVASIAGHVAQGLWLRTANREAADETARANTEHQRAIGLAVNNAAHVKRIGELEAMVRTVSADRDDAVKQTIKAKAEEIRNAKTDADAAVAFGSVFARPVLPKAGDSDPGGNDR